jgi:cytochrome c
MVKIAAALCLAGMIVLPANAASERGREVVEANCARCHATGQTGTSPHPDAPLFRELAKRFKLDDLGESLVEGLTVGHPDMPEFELEPEDAQAVIDYLKSLSP